MKEEEKHISTFFCQSSKWNSCKRSFTNL